MIFADCDEAKRIRETIENREPIEGLTDEQNEFIHHLYLIIDEVEDLVYSPTTDDFCDGMNKGYVKALEDAVHAIEWYVLDMYVYFSEKNALENDK